jgi:type IX secretion system PorP/SprF family membrane protein
LQALQKLIFRFIFEHHKPREQLNKLSRNIAFLIFAFTAKMTFSQDVSFSQFYANPMYLNPAFAGSAGIPRIGLQYRNQWSGFDNAFSTYSASFDIPVEKLQGGIGGYVINDAQADGILTSLQFNLSYAVFLRISESYYLNAAIQGGYYQNSLNTSRLVFADNLDPYYGNHGTSGELATLNDPNHQFADFSAGLMMYSERLFFGLAAHHLTEPNQSFYQGGEEVAPLERKYTAHFGAKLPVYLHGFNRKKFDISPQIIAQFQGVNQQVNYGLFATKRGLIAGTWFRQNFGFRYNAMIFVVGFMKKSWQFYYSYDFTVSGLRGNAGSTHEVSLTFLLNKSERNKNLPFFNQYEEEFGIR